MYSPPKYFQGLSKTKRNKRRREIKRYGSRDWRDPKAYVGFSTDVGVKTRKSGYVQTLTRLLDPTVKSLEEKAAATGVPLRFLKESYDRGMAAWRTGHRPGATQQQWGYARVASFLVCGKTHFMTDADLVREAKASSSAARAWWAKICKK